MAVKRRRILIGAVVLNLIVVSFFAIRFNMIETMAYGETGPVITVTSNSQSLKTLSDGRSLYGGSVSYSMNVYASGSTLESVSWSLSLNGEVYGDGSIGPKDAFNVMNGIEAEFFTIPVIVTGEFECSNVEILITAKDCSGKVSTYIQSLAIDTCAPRVTVEYQNNNVKNGKYFQDGRTLKLTVTDLNFEADWVSAASQGDASNWMSIGQNTYCKEIYFTSDGNYSFSMNACDGAGNNSEIDYTNGGVNAAPQDFVIDRTAPTVTVTFDNKPSKNEKFYNSQRNATITVSDSNFDPQGIRIDAGTVLNEVPELGSWKSNGDENSAVITFTEEGDYSVKINCTDLAGNSSEEVSCEEFTIDRTAPVAEITGINNNGVYEGEVTPVVIFKDANFDDSGYDIIWNASTYKKEKTLDYKKVSQEQNAANGKSILIEDLTHVSANDGIYTIYATVTDLAGNTYITDKVTYRLNRFGSIFTVEDEATAKLLSSGYTNAPTDIVICETNVSMIRKNNVTVLVNGSSQTLKKGEDYTVQTKHSSDGWYRCEYTIKSSVFSGQGGYVITLSSQDDAGNANTNRTGKENSYNLEANFTVDLDAPRGWIDVEGVSSTSNSIQAEKTEFTVSWEDNNGVSKAVIYVDGKEYQTIDLIDGNGVQSRTFTLEQKNTAYSIYAVLTDYAGNESTTDTVKFFLNESAFMQFFNSRGPLIGAVFAAAAVISAVIIFILKKIKKSTCI